VGAEVNYLSCDVRDAEGFAALLADVRKRLGPIESVIHGAGIIEDRLIVDKAADSFGRVLGTKLDGLLTLVNELPPEELNALAVFSSVSAYFGNPGQADYAAANEILNRVCRRLRDQWSARVVSFNWGPWAGSGMVTAEVAQQFADRGIGLVPVDGGCRLAWRELMHDDRRDVRVVCGPGDWIPRPALGGKPAWRGRPFRGSRHGRSVNQGLAGNQFHAECGGKSSLPAERP
jgi:hypothetical protein